MIPQVMESRGWKSSCPPRVPDEDLTTPYVDSFEENDHGIDPLGGNYGRRDEPHQSILPAVVAADESGVHNDMGPFSGDVLPTRTPQQKENDCVQQQPERANRVWDLHWSYTKWAVETMRFARKLTPWQKVNHFRNSNELCRKVILNDRKLGTK